MAGDRLFEVLLGWYIATTERFLSEGRAYGVDVRSAWTLENEDYFHRDQVSYPTWMVRDLAEVTDSADWVPVAAAIEDDPRTRGILGNMVVSTGMARALRPIDVAAHFLVPPQASIAFGEPADCDANLREFHQAFSRFVAFMGGDSFVFESITPLLGVECARDYRLEEDLELVKLTSDRFVLLLDSGLLSLPSLGQDSYFMSLGPRCALLRKSQIPKIVFSPEAEYKPEPDAFPLLVERFLDCIALSTSTPIKAVGAISRALTGWDLFARSMTFWHSQTLPQGKLEVVIDDEMWASVSKHWRVLTTKSVSSSLSLAIRRLQQSCLRADANDKIIDVMIAAEAVFLKGAQGELSFQLALRAAYWLSDESGPERKAMFDLFRRAYAARNIIAHGNDLKRLDKILGGESLADHVAEVAQAMQLALSKMLTDNNASTPTQEQWDAMILEKTPTQDGDSAHE